MRFVTPKTFLVGYTGMNLPGLLAYLTETENREFYEDVRGAQRLGLSDGEILCSFYAKLCYQSLTLGKNENVSRIRSIENNLQGCLSSGHGAVFEHATLNFVTHNCSRVLTHELVRHRAGTAFSQQSGRYCRLDDIGFVLPPELYDYRDRIEAHIRDTEKLVAEMEDGLGLNREGYLSFESKKKLTSAIRRVAPNGQANEMGWSVNLRALRHILQLRTSRHAEWEIRVVFNQVADIVTEKFPQLLYGAETELHDELKEYRNLRV
jgi:thymidylate synthase (FAD)